MFWKSKRFDEVRSSRFRTKTVHVSCKIYCCWRYGAHKLSFNWHISDTFCVCKWQLGSIYTVRDLQSTTKSLKPATPEWLIDELLSSVWILFKVSSFSESLLLPSCICAALHFQTTRYIETPASATLYKKAAWCFVGDGVGLAIGLLEKSVVNDKVAAPALCMPFLCWCRWDLSILTLIKFTLHFQCVINTD